MPGTEIKEMQSWVELCRAFVACTDGPPYIDSSYDDLGDCPLLREDEHNEEAARAYQRLCEELLADETADLGLRFAILYPLRQGAMANPYPLKDRKFSPLREVFLTLAGLCNSEQLAGVREVKFELHNSYLAEQGDRGAQLFRRLSVLGLMSPTELQAVRGQYIFLSVWGRRIEWELWHSLQTNFDDGYECFWPKSLDFERLEPAFSALTHPELIEPGSHSHWLLTAWSTNPRSPKPLLFPPDPLDFSTADVLCLDLNKKDEAVRRESMRSYVHELYRDFEPILPPKLSEEHLGRLHEARLCLEDVSDSSPFLSSVYQTVLARILLCLGKFELAAKKYEQAAADRGFFADPDSGGREDYRWEISFCAALCHKLGGDFQQAVSILEALGTSEVAHKLEALGSSEVAHVLEALGFSSEADLLEELGSSREGSAWWIAKWYTERGQFTEAAQWLRTEMQSRYAPKETWDLSAALAFAEFADTDLQADAFDRRLRTGNPGLHEIVVGLSKQFCPELDVLSEGSWKHWLLAASMLHTRPLFEFCKDAVYAKAVTSFAVIAEHEIKTHVFDSFLERMKDPGFAASARREKNKFEKDALLTFLFAKDNYISLKGAEDAIRECQNSILATHKLFRQHVDSVAPRLVGETANMKVLAELRNPPSHAPTISTLKDALDASRLCVRLVSCLVKELNARPQTGDREARRDLRKSKG